MRPDAKRKNIFAQQKEAETEYRSRLVDAARHSLDGPSVAITAAAQPGTNGKTANGALQKHSKPSTDYTPLHDTSDDRVASPHSVQRHSRPSQQSRKQDGGAAADAAQRTYSSPYREENLGRDKYGNNHSNVSLGQHEAGNGAHRSRGASVQAMEATHSMEPADSLDRYVHSRPSYTNHGSYPRSKTKARNDSRQRFVDDRVNIQDRSTDKESEKRKQQQNIPPSFYDEPPQQAIEPRKSIRERTNHQNEPAGGGGLALPSEQRATEKQRTRQQYRQELLAQLEEQRLMKEVERRKENAVQGKSENVIREAQSNNMFDGSSQQQVYSTKAWANNIINDNDVFDKRSVEANNNTNFQMGSKNDVSPSKQAKEKYRQELDKQIKEKRNANEQNTRQEPHVEPAVNNRSTSINSLSPLEERKKRAYDAALRMQLEHQERLSPKQKQAEQSDQDFFPLWNKESDFNAKEKKNRYRQELQQQIAEKEHLNSHSAVSNNLEQADYFLEYQKPHVDRSRSLEERKKAAYDATLRSRMQQYQHAEQADTSNASTSSFFGESERMRQRERAQLQEQRQKVIQDQYARWMKENEKASTSDNKREINDTYEYPSKQSQHKYGFSHSPTYSYAENEEVVIEPSGREHSWRTMTQRNNDFVDNAHGQYGLGFHGRAPDRASVSAEDEPMHAEKVLPLGEAEKHRQKQYLIQQQKKQLAIEERYKKWLDDNSPTRGTSKVNAYAQDSDATQMEERYSSHHHPGKDKEMQQYTRQVTDVHFGPTAMEREDQKKQQTELSKILKRQIQEKKEKDKQKKRQEIDESEREELRLQKEQEELRRKQEQEVEQERKAKAEEEHKAVLEQQIQEKKAAKQRGRQLEEEESRKEESRFQKQVTELNEQSTQLHDEKPIDNAQKNKCTSQAATDSSNFSEIDEQKASFCTEEETYQAISPHHEKSNSQSQNIKPVGASNRAELFGNSKNTVTQKPGVIIPGQDNSREQTMPYSLESSSLRAQPSPSHRTQANSIQRTWGNERYTRPPAPMQASNERWIGTGTISSLGSYGGGIHSPYNLSPSGHVAPSSQIETSLQGESNFYNPNSLEALNDMGMTVKSHGYVLGDDIRRASEEESVSDGSEFGASLETHSKLLHENIFAPESVRSGESERSSTRSEAHEDEDTVPVQTQGTKEASPSRKDSAHVQSYNNEASTDENDVYNRLWSEDIPEEEPLIERGEKFMDDPLQSHDASVSDRSATGQESLQHHGLGTEVQSSEKQRDKPVTTNAQSSLDAGETKSPIQERTMKPSVLNQNTLPQHSITEPLQASEQRVFSTVEDKNIDAASSQDAESDSNTNRYGGTRSTRSDVLNYSKGSSEEENNSNENLLHSYDIPSSLGKENAPNSRGKAENEAMDRSMSSRSNVSSIVEEQPHETTEYTSTRENGKNVKASIKQDGVQIWNLEQGKERPVLDQEKDLKLNYHGLSRPNDSGTSDKPVSALKNPPNSDNRPRNSDDAEIDEDEQRYNDLQAANQRRLKKLQDLEDMLFRKDEKDLAADYSLEETWNEALMDSMLEKFAKKDERMDDSFWSSPSESPQKTKEAPERHRSNSSIWTPEKEHPSSKFKSKLETKSKPEAFLQDRSSTSRVAGAATFAKERMHQQSVPNDTYNSPVANHSNALIAPGGQVPAAPWSFQNNAQMFPGMVAYPGANMQGFSQPLMSHPGMGMGMPYPSGYNNPFPGAMASYFPPAGAAGAGYGYPSQVPAFPGYPQFPQGQPQYPYPQFGAAMPNPGAGHAHAPNPSFQAWQMQTTAAHPQQNMHSEPHENSNVHLPEPPLGRSYVLASDIGKSDSETPRTYNLQDNSDTSWL